MAMNKTDKVFGKRIPSKEMAFLSKGWNPKKPCDIFNPYPTKRWPFKPNEPVFFLAKDGSIMAGRVTWYHPAREIDHSCCVSSGIPFFNVRSGGASHLPSANVVFDGTRKGFLSAKKVLCQAILDERLEKSKRHQQELSMNEKAYAQANGLCSPV